jgi:uncharacterized protein (TIGR02246 family)
MPDRPKVYDVTADDRDVSEIEEVIAGLSAGLNHKDAVLLDRSFTADAIMVAPDGTMVRGWEDLYAYHSTRLGGPAGDWQTAYTILDMMFLSHDVAIVHTRQDTTASDRRFANHGSFLMTKKNRSWWICSMQSTTVVAPPPTDR